MIDAKFETYDYAIGGKMVVGRGTLPDSYRMMLENGDREVQQQLKSSLVHQMAEFILENNLVEFTYQDNPIDMSRQIHVRAYLAPNDQVKILRTVNKIL